MGGGERTKGVIEFETNNANGWRERGMQIVRRTSYGVSMFGIENGKLRKSSNKRCASGGARGWLGEFVDRGRINFA